MKGLLTMSMIPSDKFSKVFENTEVRYLGAQGIRKKWKQKSVTLSLLGLTILHDELPDDDKTPQGYYGRFFKIYSKKRAKKKPRHMCV